jgi:allophanate hydrolase subunit 1
MELGERMPPTREMELSSRVVEVPVVYDDRWTRGCTADYNRYAGRDYPPDCEFVARFNRLSGLDELVETHTAPEYWVAAVGFTPGEPNAPCLDPRYALKSPYYNPPRVWTPEGTIGMGDAYTGIYSVDRAPGGGMMLGRTPLRIYDPLQRHPVFKESPSLFRVGDRMKFVAIDEEDFLATRKGIDEGGYRYRIKTYELFSVRKYLEFLERIKTETEATARRRGWKQI